MKQALVLGLALLGAVSLAPVVAAHEAGNHAAHHAHEQHGHGHAHHGHEHGHHKAGPSQEQIAGMPVASSIQISECWIRHLPLPAPSAGYFIATNKGEQAVVLTAAASPRYSAVMLHQTTHTEGMSRMSSVEGVEIAAGGQLDFKPGGYHIMLEKPQGEIKVGDTIPMQFVFTSNEKAEAQCEVKPANTLAK